MWLLRRPVLLTVGLGMALAGPYVCVETGTDGSLRKRWHQLLGQQPASAANDPLHDLTLPPETAVAGMAFTSTGSAGPQAIGRGATIEEAFQFEVTPDWVASRWQRVSTVLGETDQLGMRVAYVSGTRADDVAGSLTYYFDPHHRLQRITFYGTTGDAQRLLTTVVVPNGLASRPTTGAAHYIAGNPAQPTSEVSVRHLPIVDSQSPVRLEVAIDLRRSGVQGFGKWQARDRHLRVPPRSY